ncbi:MAG: type II toxin-antitoxin system VapC family toxin [Deltaproteobacteria bacterium]|nr:type II toxin-antitoxin system VapC family toxin [Deltaproteobacteria bacterium]
MIVLDASAATELVLRTPRGARVNTRIGVETLHVPHVLDLEVCSALRSLERLRQITTPDASQAIDDFLAVDFIRHSHELFVMRIWELRHNAAPYDAMYLALAEVLPAPIVTCDAKLARTPGHRATIEVL